MSNADGHRDIKVLDVLWDHFGDGTTPGELAKAAGIAPSGVSRALQSLARAGYAEQIPETGRWRLSHRVARKAIAVYRSVERATQRVNESRQRLGLEEGL